MRKEAWKSTGTAVYNINYHFVWSTKYRKKILIPPIEDTLKAILIYLCENHGYQLITMEVMPDHVHVFLSAPPKVAPSVIAKVLKGSSARVLFARHQKLKRELWGGHLWNPSYYVGTAGDVSRDTVQKYIELQKAGEHNAHDREGPAGPHP